MSSVWQDVRFAARLLRHQLAFSLTAIACLTVGIGVTTALFSMVNGVLLRPLPFFESDRLVMLRSVNPSAGALHGRVSGPDFLDWQLQSKSFRGIAAFQWRRIDLARDENFHRVHGFRVSNDYFSVLHAAPRLGRVFLPEEQTLDDRRIILNDRVWRTWFQADPDIVGRNIKVNSWVTWPDGGSESFVVVGVLPAELRFIPPTTSFPREGQTVDSIVEFCSPLRVHTKSDRAFRELDVVARLKDGVSVEQAQAEMNTIAARLRLEFADSNDGWEIQVVSLRHYVLGEIQPVLWTLFGCGMCVLVIGCVNVSGLLFVHANARQSEMAVRTALGADFWNIVRQLLVESLLLATIGGLGGLLLAYWCLDLIRTFAPPDLPRVAEVSIDETVLLFSLGATICAGLLAGIIPAMRVARPNLNELLSSASRAATPARNRQRMAKAFATGEVALSLILLVAAGLMVRNFLENSRGDFGFDPHNRLTMTISLPEGKHNWNFNSDFCNQVIDRVKSLPGVKSAAAIRGLPMGATKFDCTLTLEGQPYSETSDLPPAVIRVVTDDYFKTMAIPLLKGRLFIPSDSVGEIGVGKWVLINEAMARRCWPNENPIGQRFKVHPDLPFWIEVVGVVGNVRHSLNETQITSDIFYPEKLFPQAEITLLVHTELAPLGLAKAVTTEVLRIDPDAYVTDVNTMDGVISQALAERRFSLMLLTTFAVVSLILALTGIYGMMSYLVAGRKREIGIRMALGAQPESVLWLIFREGLAIVCVGLGIGLFAAVAVSELNADGAGPMQTSEPVVLAVVVVLLGACGLLACFLAARKAIMIEPMDALRCE